MRLTSRQDRVAEHLPLRLLNRLSFVPPGYRFFEETSAVVVVVRVVDCLVNQSVLEHFVS